MRKAEPVERACDGELSEEFHERARAADVVVETEYTDRDTAKQEGDSSARVGVEHPAHAAGFEQERQERGVEACDDGDTAQARDGTAMDLAGRDVVVEEMVLQRETPHPRRQ